MRKGFLIYVEMRKYFTNQWKQEFMPETNGEQEFSQINVSIEYLTKLLRKTPEIVILQYDSP
jgi:hypothetical protein